MLQPLERGLAGCLRHQRRAGQQLVDPLLDAVRPFGAGEAGVDKPEAERIPRGVESVRLATCQLQARAVSGFDDFMTNIRYFVDVASDYGADFIVFPELFTLSLLSCETKKLTPMEAMAADWIAEHPEYHADLADLPAALAAVYDVEAGRANPFLHLAMHLSISEQLSIDQPRGIRQAVDLLAARRGSMHDAHHEVMECLGEMMWASQRSGLPPDGHAYLEAVRKRATRD